ncbi:hypothetical protein FQN55_008120 [Onygenales sp. PD_40]|nr:hypothetical protein FQN55_008120 [Onygenales sp. PD_40]KAK2790739.1 hypothetical protein FQN52_005496 [Onygenales sp. PD_12]
MDYGYMASPSGSPEIHPFAFIGETGESTSDSSSPASPNDMKHGMYTPLSGGYDMAPLDNSTPYFMSASGKIPLEYITSTTLDEHDRRRRRSSLAKDNENITNMHLRRRAQNRASQRAFRERKEKHVKGLESQLHDLHSKHQDLIHNYSRQTEEVQRLNSRIRQLTSELDLLRTANDGSPFGEMLVPDKFDIVPYPNMSYSGPQYYFDKDAVKASGDLSFGPADDPL